MSFAGTKTLSKRIQTSKQVQLNTQSPENEIAAVQPLYVQTTPVKLMSLASLLPTCLKLKSLLALFLRKPKPVKLLPLQRI